MKRILLILALCSPVWPQAWSGILDPARAVDWTKAGIPGGIPSGTWANCVTTACNTLNGGTVTSASINAALLSAPNQTVVRVPAGNFTISGNIFTNRSQVVLRGAGPTQTKLTMSTGNIFFGATGSGYLGGEPGLAASNWTAGLTKGTTVITLASTSGLAAGRQIGLDQLNDTSIVFTLGSDGTLPGVNRNGTTNFDGSVTRTQHQLVEILAVCTGNNTPAGFGCTAANQLAIDPPVAFTAQSGLTPQAYWWTPANVQYDGLENIRIDCNAGDFCVNFSFASYFWAKNVEVDNGRHSEIRSYFGYRGEIRDSYLNEPDLGGGPTQYGVEMADSTLIKVENNIVFNVTSGILPDTSIGIVNGYNYLHNITSGNQFGDIEPHAVHNYLHLYEGNILDSFTIDNVWGSHSQTTLFRNRSTGFGLNKVSNFRIPLSVCAHNRYMNLLGNVWGTQGYHTVYQIDDTNFNGATDNFIMQVGFFNRYNFNQNPYDTVAKTSLMRWGNWDTATYLSNGNTNGIRYCTGSGAGNPACTASETASTDPTFPGLASPSQTFPASFYLASKPAWFGSVAWPAIGPDVTGGNLTNTGGHANKIPAELCYENTAKDVNGYLTAFDAATCYVAAGPSPGVSFTPPTIGFGNQLVGTPSTPQSTTLTNTGTGVLNITSISITGTNAADYGQSNTCGATLDPGLTCSITVTFTPSATGVRSASISLVSDAPGSPHTVSLSGAGVLPTVTLTPASKDFGNQPVGVSSAAQNFIFSNTGPGTVTISTISFSGSAPGDYSQSNNCPGSLGPTLSCTISVTFTPVTTGTRSSSLTVTSNATNSPTSSTLTGVGIISASGLSNLELTGGVSAH